MLEILYNKKQRNPYKLLKDIKYIKTISSQHDLKRDRNQTKSLNTKLLGHQLTTLKGTNKEQM